MEKSISQQKTQAYTLSISPAQSNRSDGRLEAEQMGGGVAWGNQAAGDANVTDVLTLS